MQVLLPDNRPLEMPEGATGIDLANRLGGRFPQEAIALKIDDHLADLRTPLAAGQRVALLTAGDPEALDVLRHSTSHVMAEAVQKLFPGTQVTIGPSIEDGFYYDFDKPGGFKPEDLETIAAEMKQSIAAGRPFVREVVSRDEARQRFEKMGEKFKLELLDAIPPGEPVSLYRHGAWVDLCRGPHVQHTGQLKTFALLSIAGAYWRGDARNPMLSRIYGTAFAKQADLDHFITRREEAKKRDHRRLGKDLDLFSIRDEIGGGLVLWHPRGAMVRMLIEDFWRKEHLKEGYELVNTPHLGRAHLWQTSGHLEFYRDAMYAPMEVEGQPYYIKPMNCPFHMHIYQTRLRSYRDLPLRYAEMGTVYRFERSGVLHGLMRVRGFTQDDAHIFCTPEQLEGEVVRLLDFCLALLRSFGFEKFDAYLATQPPKSVGRAEDWERAAASLKNAATIAGLQLHLDEGGGAFYGPKIDLKLRDCLNREWQCSTIQFDFNLPERFDINYVGDDNHPHRPYVIHRALLGSLERFFGVLIEHYGGAFPVWLAPVQVAILPVADRHLPQAQELAARLREHELRVEIDGSNNKLGYKIRAAEMQKTPFMLVLGDRDIEKGGASVRTRGREDLGFLELQPLLEKLLHEARTPRVPRAGKAP